MGLTWEEAEVAALDRLKWRRCVAQYVQVDLRWTKDQGPAIAKDFIFDCYELRLCSAIANSWDDDNADEDVVDNIS